VINYLVTHKDQLGRNLLLVLLSAAFIGGLQAAMFFNVFSARVAEANVQLFDLMVENAQRTLYREIAAQIETLDVAPPETDDEERSLGDAWDDFQSHFATAPREAVVALVDELPALTAAMGADRQNVTRISADLERLGQIYADSYKTLLAELDRPPAYVWPVAVVLAERSGYRQSVRLNRALYLAQTGDIGTARVMLAGLNASADDPRIRATIYYLLGRLQFELFRATPEVEYFTQALQYLRQSLQADPELQLAKRLLDFLLSLPQSAAAPQSAEGRPETPSEGEGAAVSAEKRVF
jgi:hypothetical protein